jgi:HEAT repeat protein
MLSKASAVVLGLALLMAGNTSAADQNVDQPGTPAEAQGPQTLSPEAIEGAINELGNLEYPIRMNASRALRRAAPAAVTPALIRAVESHKDQFVRFRALVLLTGFSDARTAGVVREIITNPNDRLRAVAYMYYEHHPAANMLPTLLSALEREESEFVRPALVRALAAQANDPRVRKRLLVEVGRGQDFFRGAVIEALGDHNATYAVEPLMAIAALEGPLQGDAVIALGKLKDRRAMQTLAGLQRTAPRDIQPTIAAAICLIGINCDAHVPYLIETLNFADKNLGQQAMLRSTVAGLVALANAGNVQSLTALLDVGVAAVDPPRAPMALGAATIAVRNTPVMLAFLESYERAEGAIRLIAEGFEMLEEDYEEESFFATVRSGYWRAPESSPTRRVAEALIDELEF